MNPGVEGKRGNHLILLEWGGCGKWSGPAIGRARGSRIAVHECVYNSLFADRGRAGACVRAGVANGRRPGLRWAWRRAGRRESIVDQASGALGRYSASPCTNQSGEGRSWKQMLSYNPTRGRRKERAETKAPLAVQLPYLLLLSPSADPPSAVEQPVEMPVEVFEQERLG